MRILYVHSGSDLYGASKALLRMVECAVRQGEEVSVILPDYNQLGLALERLGIQAMVEPQLAVASRVGGKPLASVVGVTQRLVRSVWSLLRIFRRVQPDVVHSNTATVLSGAVAARIAGIPHVWHVREIFDEFPLVWPCFRWIMGVCSSRIICISEAVASRFRAGFASKRVEVIYDGLGAADLAWPNPDEVREFRSRLGISPEARVAAVVGRIKLGRKGQETFVRAAAQIVGRVPDAIFLIIGTAFPGNEDHTRRLKSLIEELHLSGKVILTGDVGDMRVAYAAIDLLVLSSGLPEPFGLVLIEAMGFGKPVIGTAHGGPVEIIEDGVSGFLVPPNCPEKMADAMNRLLADRDLGALFGSRGRASVTGRFGVDRTYAEVRAVYAAIYKQPKGSMRPARRRSANLQSMVRESDTTSRSERRS